MCPVLISVVTPVGEHAATSHLLDAYRSLDAQQLPTEHAWEWLVQLDCQAGGPALPTHLIDDPRVTIGRNRRGGPAVARTTALARSRGNIVRNLDADDQLTPGALADAAHVLAAQPTIGWTACPCVDLLPDGSSRRWDRDPPPGRLPIGSIGTLWARTRQLSVHPATLTIRRDLLIALGGWMALPVSEDLGLLLALETLTAGWFLDQPGVIRRTHPGQMTKATTHDEEKDALRGLVAERAQALAALLGSRYPGTQ